MKPSVSEAEFDVMVKQTGLPLSAEQKADAVRRVLDAGSDDRAREQADAARDRAGAHVHHGGAVMDRIPHHRRGREADRGEEAVAGRADPGLPRAHRRRIDDTLHAFILPTEERALADARAAEARVMAGNAKGPLDGIPIGHKDIYNTAGIRTTGAFEAAGAQRPDAGRHHGAEVGRGRHGADGQAVHA